MRTEAEVQDRIRYLLTQELSRRVAASQRRVPQNCAHYHAHGLDCRKTVGGQENRGYNRLAEGHLPVLGLCMLGAQDPASWEGKICEDPVDAEQSEFFQLRQTPEEVRSEFEGQIQDLGWVREHLPEVYGLLWALGSDTTPRLPWWKALWFWVMQIRPDLLRPALPGGRRGVVAAGSGV